MEKEIIKEKLTNITEGFKKKVVDLATKSKESSTNFYKSHKDILNTIGISTFTLLFGYFKGKADGIDKIDSLTDKFDARK